MDCSGLATSTRITQYAATKMRLSVTHRSTQVHRQRFTLKLHTLPRRIRRQGMNRNCVDIDETMATLLANVSRCSTATMTHIRRDSDLNNTLALLTDDVNQLRRTCRRVSFKDNIAVVRLNCITVLPTTYGLIRVIPFCRFTSIPRRPITRTTIVFHNELAIGNDRKDAEHVNCATLIRK